MSKASDYANQWFQATKMRPKEFLDQGTEIACVEETGACYIHDTIRLSPEKAIKFANWILDNFK